MRLTPRRFVYLALSALGILFLFMSRRQNADSEHECLSKKPSDHRILSNLAGKVHKTLEMLQTPHFLCYESLWASLYNEGPRTWDTTVDFCLIGSNLAEQDEGFIQKVFKSQDLLLSYDMLEGIYNVHLLKEPEFKEGKTDLFAQLFLFQKSSIRSMNMMLRKSGVKRALLPEDCDNPLLECFPNLLIKQPLPYIKFGPHELPGPREGIEIQKYHYPDDWWLQRKIPSC